MPSVGNTQKNKTSAPNKVTPPRPSTVTGHAPRPSTATGEHDLADMLHRASESRLSIRGPCGPMNKTGSTARPEIGMGLCHPEVPSLCLTAVVQLLTRVWLFLTQWTAAHQASLSFTVSQSLLKLMPIESVMSSKHLILYCPLLFLPSVFPGIRVFPNEPFTSGGQSIRASYLPDLISCFY